MSGENIKMVELAPTEETYQLIEEHAGNVREAIRQTFFYMGRESKDKIRKDINDKQSKRGRWYIKRDKIGRKLRRRRSAPGQTHANDSFELRESLGWKVNGADSMEIGYGVTRPAPEHSQIEEGYGNVAARPSLKNNLENVTFESFFHKALANLEG